MNEKSIEFIKESILRDNERILKENEQQKLTRNVQADKY